MPLSDSEIRRQVIPDFRDKIILERALRRKIKIFDKRIVTRFQADLLSGETTRGDAFQDELESLLRDFYGSVSSKFKGRTLRRLSGGRSPLSSKEKERLERAVTLFARRRAVDQSRIVLETTHRNMHSAVQLAASETVDQVETAINAAAILSRKLKSRETGIVSLETQAMAEATKLAEADMIAKKEPLTLQTPQEPLTKEWVTQGDERVRPAHVSADSQLQRTQDLYVVMGQQLMFPGDTRFGATAANVINCRCDSVYSRS